MPRPPRNRGCLPKNPTAEPNRHSELLVSKQGVYMVRGDNKLKTIQLIPWDQIIPSLRPTKT